jgi:hypothetical protein
MSRHEGGHVERGDVELRFTLACRRGDQHDPVAGRAQRKPFWMLNIPVAARDLHGRFQSGRILDENGVGRTAEIVADAVRFKGEPFAVLRPLAGARLKLLQEAWASRRPAVHRRHDRAAEGSVGHPDIVEVLIKVIGLALELSREGDNSWIDLIDARKAGPDRIVGERSGDDRDCRGIDLGGDLFPGSLDVFAHIDRHELAIRIPGGIDHALGFRQLCRHRAATSTR